MNQSDGRDSVGQSADLRTRIAAAIMESCHGVYMDDAVDAADAVIRELKLEREFSIGDDHDGRVLWLDCEKPSTPQADEIVEVRWISPWEPACGHPGCTCQRCQGDWCGDVGNVTYGGTSTEEHCDGR